MIHPAGEQMFIRSAGPVTGVDVEIRSNLILNHTQRVEFNAVHAGEMLECK